MLLEPSLFASPGICFYLAPVCPIILPDLSNGSAVPCSHIEAVLRHQTQTPVCLSVASQPVSYNLPIPHKVFIVSADNHIMLPDRRIVDENTKQVVPEFPAGFFA